MTVVGTGAAGLGSDMACQGVSACTEAGRSP